MDISFFLERRPSPLLIFSLGQRLKWLSTYKKVLFYSAILSYGGQLVSKRYFNK